MPKSDSETSRAETITAALIYLMSQYAHTGCPRLALCVSRHMECLAAHPGVTPVVRDVCAGLCEVWSRTASSGSRNDQPVH